LCELHKRLIEGAKDVHDKGQTSRPTADLHKLMDAINTLEALRANDNAANFFEQVCSPSRDEAARKLTETYQKGEFAKRAMLRYLFKDSEMGSDMERVIEEESGRGSKPKASVASAAKTEELWTMGVFGVVLVLLLGGAYHFL